LGRAKNSYASLYRLNRKPIPFAHLVIGKKLEGDEAMQAGVFGLVNDAPSSTTEFANDSVCQTVVSIMAEMEPFNL
jgi:hypothetical protein